MPRVRSSDSLYKPVTNKVLPQLPRPETTHKHTPGTTQDPIPDEEVQHNTSKKETVDKVQAVPPIRVETVTSEEHAWQEFRVQNQNLTRWTMSTNLKAAMEQNKIQLQNINTSRVKYDCLVELCKGISETNAQLQTLYHQVVDQHQALTQKEAQLLNTSNFVLERNGILITKCRLFLASTTNSYHKLEAEYNKALAHAKETMISEQCTRVPKDNDLDKEIESLVALNKDVGIVTENITSINGLLACHKHNIDTQIDTLNAEVINLASKKSSSRLRKILCFH